MFRRPELFTIRRVAVIIGLAGAKKRSRWMERRRNGSEKRTWGGGRGQ